MSEPLTVPVSWEDRPFLITAAGSENLVLRALLSELKPVLAAPQNFTPGQRETFLGLIDAALEYDGEAEQNAARCHADDALPPIEFSDWETALPDDDPDIYAGTYSED